MLGSVDVWLTFHPPSLSTRQGRRFVSIGDLLVGHLGDSGSLDLAGPVALGSHAVEGRFLGERPGEGQGKAMNRPRQAGCVPGQVREASDRDGTTHRIICKTLFFSSGRKPGSIHKRRKRIVDAATQYGCHRLVRSS